MSRQQTTPLRSIGPRISALAVGALAFGATAVASAQTTSAEYAENVGAERRETAIRAIPALTGTGAVLVGAPYIAGAIVAATNSNSYDNKLLYPVAGPWINLVERPCTFGSNCSSADNWNAALLIADGIAQWAGIVLLVTSFVLPAYKETAGARAKREKPHIAVTPVSLKGGAGIGAVGTF